MVTLAGPSGYHLIAMLQFNSLAAIQEAFGSAEGQAAVADVTLKRGAVQETKVARLTREQSPSQARALLSWASAASSLAFGKVTLASRAAAMSFRLATTR